MIIEEQLGELMQKYLGEPCTPQTIERVKSDLKSALPDYTAVPGVNSITICNVDVPAHEIAVTVLPIKSSYDVMRDHYVERYGEHKGNFMANRLAKMIRNCNDKCLDNFREADKSVQAEVDTYFEAQSHGCCGFADMEFEYTPPDGKPTTIMLGFNYGH